MNRHENYKTTRLITHPHKVVDRSNGFSLIELMMVLGIMVTVLGIALPIITTTMTSMHLGSAASSLAGAIQSTRYRAISSGCPCRLTVLPSSNSYQIATESISGSPPACAVTYDNVENPIPFAGTDISTTFNTPIVLNPSGTVTAVGNTLPGSFSVVLAGNSATKTVSVTGVGNVKVTSP